MLCLRITISVREENHAKVHNKNVHYDAVYLHLHSQVMKQLPEQVDSIDKHKQKTCLLTGRKCLAEIRPFISTRTLTQVPTTTAMDLQSFEVRFKVVCEWGNMK